MPSSHMVSIPFLLKLPIGTKTIRIGVDYEYKGEMLNGVCCGFGVANLYGYELKGTFLFDKQHGVSK